MKISAGDPTDAWVLSNLRNRGALVRTNTAHFLIAAQELRRGLRFSGLCASPNSRVTAGIDAAVQAPPMDPAEACYESGMPLLRIPLATVNGHEDFRAVLRFAQARVL
jgi:hypothetical protein